MTKRVWLWIGLFFVIVLSIIFLGGCATAPDHGYVHDKDYSPAYSYPQNYCAMYSTQRSGNSSYTYCAMWLTHTVTIPANWALDVYASKDDHGWVDVDEGTFDHVRVGDYWSLKGSNSEGTF